MDAPWTCSAAYVYALHLDPASRAWEYLRRNPHYVRDWVRYRRRASHGIAARWGLEVLIDPQLDARQVSPVWAIDALSPVMLVRDETESPRKCEIAVERFSLWRLAGRKVLFEGEDGLRLATHIIGRDVGLRLGDYLCDGDRFAYQVPAAADERTAWRAVNSFRELTVVCGSGKDALRRPGRADLFHARALQILDGLAAGAAQRELAVALFGVAAVGRGWQPDGALRAQVRYLIRRARALMAGEYRTLIDPDRPDPVSQDVPHTKATSHEV